MRKIKKNRKTSEPQRGAGLTFTLIHEIPPRIRYAHLVGMTWHRVTSGGHQMLTLNSVSYCPPLFRPGIPLLTPFDEEDYQKNRKTSQPQRGARHQHRAAHDDRRTINPTHKPQRGDGLTTTWIHKIPPRIRYAHLVGMT